MFVSHCNTNSNVSEHFFEFEWTAKEDLKMFQWYTNRFKYSSGDKIIWKMGSHVRIKMMYFHVGQFFLSIYNHSLYHQVLHNKTNQKLLVSLCHWMWTLSSSDCGTKTCTADVHTYLDPPTTVNQRTDCRWSFL